MAYDKNRHRGEKAMKDYKGPGNMKRLIKDDDNTLRDCYELLKHGRKTMKNKSVAYMDGQELEDEINGYIEFCIEHKQVPSQVGLALWLGVTTETISNWKSNSSFIHYQIIKRTLEIFHKFIEQKALDGEINPVLYMFYGKNWFGLSDKTEIVHKSQTTQVIDISEQQRILRSTPGVVIDADFTERSENLGIETRAENLGAENLGIAASENLGTENLGLENLGDVLRGNLKTYVPENLRTDTHTHVHTETHTPKQWEEDL